MTEKIEIRAGNSYLIKRKGSNHVEKIKIHEVTKTCYKIQFERSESFYIEKTNFNFDYSIVEEFAPSLIDILIENKY